MTTDPRLARAIDLIREDWEGTHGLIGIAIDVVADLETVDWDLQLLTRQNEQLRDVLNANVVHEGHTGPCVAYADPINGGWDGYEGACWACDWRGPRHARDDKRGAQEDAIAHWDMASKAEQ